MEQVGTYIVPRGKALNDCAARAATDPTARKLAILAVRRLMLRHVRIYLAKKGRPDLVDDIFTMVILHLYKSIHRYDRTRSAWTTFSSLLCLSHMGRLFCSATCSVVHVPDRVDSPARVTVLLPDDYPANGTTTTAAWLHAVHQEELGSVLHAARGLPPSKRRVLRMLLKGVNVLDIAKRIHKTRQRVYQIRNEIILYLQDRLIPQQHQGRVFPRGTSDGA